MKKKILFFVMTFFVVCLLTVCVSAVEVDGIHYSFTKTDTYPGYDGTATVNTDNRTLGTLTEVDIPEIVEYDSNNDGIKEKYIVRAIASQAFGNNSNNVSPSPVVSITIPKTVASIGNHAFRRLEHCTTITIKASGYNPVTGETSEVTFNDAEFYQSYALVTVDMSESNITVIGKVCFQGDSALKTVLFSKNIKSIGANAFAGCSSLTTISSLETVETIESCAFQSNTSLKGDLKLSSLTSLGNNAFQSCKAITSADFTGSSITKIPQHAFHSCSALKTVKLPETVKEIGLTAFVSCSELTSCNIPSSLTSIDSQAFYQTKLTGDLVLGSLTNLGSQAFRGTSITSVDFTGSTFTSLSEHQFRDCSSLTKVVLPDTQITTIPQAAFYNCSLLTSINIPSSVRVFGDSAFYGSKITGDIVVDYLESISNHAFRQTNITSFTAKDGSATTIGSDAVFYTCKELKYVILPSSVTTIPKETFTNCNSLLYIIASENITSAVSKPPKADIIIRGTEENATTLATVFSGYAVAPFSEFDPATAGTKTIYYGAVNAKDSVTTFVEFDGFDKSFSAWDSTTNTETIYAPIFEAQGYSTNPEKTSIATGFNIIKTSFDAYKTLFGGEVNFGIVIFNPKYLGTDSLFNAEGNFNANDGYLMVNIGTEYSTCSLSVQGFNELNSGIELVFAGFAYADDITKADFFQKEYVGTEQSPVSSPMVSKVTRKECTLYTTTIASVCTHVQITTGKESLGEYTIA